jgi:hypothetical protein
MAGAYAGNRLGAVRDAKGKAVAAVFAELGGEQKAEVWVGVSWTLVARCMLNYPSQIIKVLAMKLFGPSGII